jgi:hypothetical protein
MARRTAVLARAGKLPIRRHLCITSPAEVTRREARPALTGAQAMAGRASCINQTGESRGSNGMITATTRVASRPSRVDTHEAAEKSRNKVPSGAEAL